MILRGTWLYLMLLTATGILFFSCKQSKSATSTKTPSNTSRVQKSRNVSELTKAGINVRDLQNNRLGEFIQDWYGVPYKYGGCQKAGVDCSCFANLLYDHVYGKKLSRSSTEIFKACDLISLEDAKEGDLLFFKIGGSQISHVGILLQGNLFIHSSTSKGVIVNSIEEAYYRKYFFSAGKMKGI